MAQGFWNPQGRVGPLNNAATVGGQPSTTGVSADGGYSPPAGMGYAGASPVQLPGVPTLGPNQASPVQLPGQQPSSGAGGVLGAMTPRPMSQRETQMMARYLPGSGAGVDPLASRGSVAQAGGWQNFARQNYGSKVGGMFDQFMRQNPGMNSYQDAVNNPVIGAMIRRKGYL